MHPTHDELIGLVHGTLDEQSADSVAGHIEACAVCEDTVRELETVADDVIQQLRTPAAPGHFEAEPGCRDLVSVVAAIGRDLSIEPTAAATQQDAEPDLGVIRDYQLLSQIGAGGMGAVYKALHTRLQKVVALKVLPAGRMNDPQAVQRFEREMQAVGRLSHPNIVGAHDAGEHEGTHFLVMEHVDGLDLSGLIRHLGPLPIADACELARQAAVGLQHAHEHDLVHRDIKPSNLMLGPDGQVKILDLGLARLHIRDQAELTSTGQMMGTLDYIAPEQTGDSHDVDIRADIFSLGATLYKLLTGVTPYSDPRYNTAVKRLAALANDPIPPIQERRDDVPAELATVVSRMLAKDPDERFGTPAEVAQALEQFAAGAEPAALLSRAQHSAAVQGDSVSAGNSTFPHVSSFARTDPDRRHAANTPAEAFESDSKHLPPELEPTFIRPASENERSTRNPRRTIVACALMGLGILLGAFIVFRVNVPGGTIVLECDPAALEDVTITIDGDEFTIELPGDNRPVTIGVDDRRGQLRITKAGFKAFTKDFEIAVGADEHSIKVRFEPLMPVVMPVPEPQEWQPGPAENVLHGLIPRPATFAGIKRWQIETTLPRASIFSASFSPDGKLLACGTESGHVRIYKADTLELVDFVVGPTKRVMSVAWSPDGQWLASCGEARFVHLWHAKEKRTTTVTVDRAPVTSLSWAPDSKRFVIATPQSAAVQVWTVEGSQKLWFPTSYPVVVAWSPNGQSIASGSSKQQLRLWSAVDNSVGPTVETDDAITSIAWRPDSQQLVTGHQSSNKVLIWNADGTPRDVLEGSSFPTYSLAWSPDEKLLVSVGTQIKVHNLENDLHSMIIQGPRPSIFGVCWDPQGDRFATVGEKRTIQVWRPDGTRLKESKGHTADNGYCQVAWSHDGQFLATADTKPAVVRIWNSRGVIHNVLKGISPIAWHPSKQQIVMNQRGVGFETRDSEGLLVALRPGATGLMRSLAWSPDSERLAAGRSVDGIAEIWMPGVVPITTIKARENGPVNDLAWSPNGDALVTVGGDATRFWKPDGTPGTVIEGTGTGRSVAWNPTSDRIAQSGETTIILGLDGTREPELTGFRGGVDYSVDWSPDGTQLVTGSMDGTVRLWSDEGASQAVLHDHDSTVVSVDWSPTGELIASGSNDCTTIVWDAETTEPLWVGVQLGTGASATFSAAGQVLDGDPDVIEEHFVYLVENEDGQQELLKPSEFQKRISLPHAPSTLDAPSKPHAPSKPVPDPDRVAAEWVRSINSHHFTYIVIRQDGKERKIGHNELKPENALPTEPFELTGVFLQYNRDLNNEGLVSLRDCKHLTMLNFTYTGVGDAGLVHLKACCPNLRELHLPGGVTDVGLASFRECRELTRLTLHGSNADTAGLKNFRHCRKLTSLSLGGVNLTGDSLESFAGCTALEILNLKNTRLDAVELAYFKDCTKLKALDLSGNPAITSKELGYLQNCRELTGLDLAGTNVDDEGLSFLSDFKRLRSLGVGGTNVSDAFVESLQGKLPNCRIGR